MHGIRVESITVYRTQKKSKKKKAPRKAVDTLRVVAHVEEQETLKDFCSRTLGGGDRKYTVKVDLNIIVSKLPVTEPASAATKTLADLRRGGQRDGGAVATPTGEAFLAYAYRSASRPAAVPEFLKEDLATFALGHAVAVKIKTSAALAAASQRGANEKRPREPPDSGDGAGDGARAVRHGTGDKRPKQGGGVVAGGLAAGMLHGTGTKAGPGRPAVSGQERATAAAVANAAATPMGATARPGRGADPAATAARRAARIQKKAAEKEVRRVTDLRTTLAGLKQDCKLLNDSASARKWSAVLAGTCVSLCCAHQPRRRRLVRACWRVGNQAPRSCVFGRARAPGPAPRARAPGAPCFLKDRFGMCLPRGVWRQAPTRI